MVTLNSVHNKGTELGADMSSTIDLDMLAVDLADMLAKYDYLDGNACETDIRPHLAEFVAKIQASIAARPADELSGSDAASWSVADVAIEDGPLPQTGRRPRATYMDWQRSQLVNLGASAVDEWYWQCPTSGCKVWAGPYSDPIAAKQVGFEHVYTCEKTDYFRRGRQS